MHDFLGNAALLTVVSVGRRFSLYPPVQLHGVQDLTSPPSPVGFTTVSNHSSSTWCRKMFERQGEMTPPCREPSVVHGATDKG